MTASFVAINSSKANFDEICAMDESIVTICSGRNRPIGARYARVGADSSQVTLEP